MNVKFDGMHNEHPTNELRGTGIPQGGDLLLPFGQFTLCRACGEEPICVAARNLVLRRGKEMGGHIGPPLRKRNSTAVFLIVSVL